MLLRPFSMFAVLSFALAMTSGCANAQSSTADDRGPGSKSRQVTRTEQGPKRVREKAQSRRGVEQETTLIVDVIDIVSRSTGKRFLLDYRVPARIVTGPGGHSDMDFGTFLTVLANNGLAAVETGAHVTVMPTAMVRQVQTPVVPVGATAPADAWVTRVFLVEHVPAPQLVPVLRPLLPTSAHLAAQANSNALIVVDRFANTERLRAVIAALDVPTEGQ